MFESEEDVDVDVAEHSDGREHHDVPPVQHHGLADANEDEDEIFQDDHDARARHGVNADPVIRPSQDDPVLANVSDLEDVEDLGENIRLFHDNHIPERGESDEEDDIHGGRRFPIRGDDQHGQHAQHLDHQHDEHRPHPIPHIQIGK